MSYSHAQQVSDAIDEVASELTMDDIEMLALHIQEVRQKIARREYLGMEVGDRVHIRNIKPKYLTGMTGTLLRKTGGKLEIEIDARYDTRRYGHKVTVPAACVERME